MIFRKIKIGLVFVLAILTTQFTDAQNFLFENFNGAPGSTFPTGWTAVRDGATGTDWVIQTPGPTKFPTLTMLGSNFAYVDADAGGSGSTTNSTLTSPAFNTASSTLLFLEFNQAYRKYQTDTAIVEVFNGTNWVAVQKKTVSTENNGLNQEKVTYNISNLKNANMRVRFRYLGFWPWFWAVDNVRVFSPAANDVGVSSIDSPLGDCGLSATSQVKITVSNFGSAAQTSIPASFRINTGAVVNQTFTGNIPPGGNQSFTFTTTANLGAAGTYTVRAWTNLTGDVSALNDSSKSQVTKVGQNLQIVNFQSYDGANLADNNPGWREASGNPPSGTTSTWRAPTTAQMDALGTITAAINLFTTGKREWILSPNIPVGPNTGVVFKLAVTTWQTAAPGSLGSDDSLKVMVSTDCGNSWQLLSFFNKASALPNQLVQRVIPLAQFSGQEIRLGFLATEGVIDDPEDIDLHIDDIEIRNIPDNDITMSAISSPVSGCTGVAPTLTVRVRNTGILPQSNYSVCYRINGAAAVCTTLTSTLNSNEEIALTLTSATATLNSPGDYTISAYTNLGNDAIRANDTIKNYFFQNIPLISSFPYFQSFETNNGGWIPGGTLSSWALGTPNKTVIQGAAQGTKAYVTGGLGNGTYNNNEKSFVLSPCMDFSTLAKPMFEMRAWWHSEAEADGAIIQASTNGGGTWTTVGTLNGITKWYNTTGISGLEGLVTSARIGWSGGVKYNNGSGGWVLVRAAMPSLANQPDVKIRIAFGANASITTDGFAFDAIRISNQPSTELAFANFERPIAGGCGLNPASKVAVRVQNQSVDTVRNATFGFRVGSGAAVSEPVTGISIAPNAFYSHTFAATANLSSGNTFTLTGWAKAANDPVAQNDSGKTTVNRNEFFTDTVNFVGFNGNNFAFLSPGWWLATGATTPVSNSLLFLQPSGPQPAYVGPNAVRLNMASSNRNEWIVSPGYKISPNSYLGFEVATTFGFDTTEATNGGINNTDDKVRVMASTDCGETWTEVYSIGAGNNINRVFKRFFANLSSFANQEIRFAIKLTTGPTVDANTYDIFIRNISVDNLSPNDVGVTSILSPTQSCGLTANTQIRIAVKNYSSNAVSNVPVYFRINGGIKVYGSVAGPIASGQTVSYLFPQTTNLGISQPYTILAGTEFEGDSAFVNDESSVVLSKLSVPVPIQSLIGFTGANLPTVLPGWTEAAGAVPVAGNSSWTNGLIAGENCLKVKYSGSQKKDWVISPGIKLSSSNFLRFNAGQFSVGSTGSSVFDIDDSLTVMISTNCGTSWSRLYVMAKNTTPALTNSMQQVSVSLNAFANQEVRIAFRAGDGTRKDDSSDVYINKIEINSTLTQDAGPIQILFDPTLSTNVFLQDTTYAVSVRVNNFGTEPVANVGVGVRFAGGFTLTQTIAGPIASGQAETVALGNFTPTQLGTNLVAKAYSSITGDQAISNDTLFLTYIVATPTATDPLDKAGKISVYPNPASNFVWINGLTPGQSYTFQLFDVLGKEMVNQAISGTSSEKLNLPVLPKGVYRISVTSKESNHRMTLPLLID